MLPLPDPDGFPPSWQASLMFKIVLAQWMNTGFIIYIIQNIHEAPTEDYITQVSLLSTRDVACTHHELMSRRTIALVVNLAGAFEVLSPVFFPVRFGYLHGNFAPPLMLMPWRASRHYFRLDVLRRPGVLRRSTMPHELRGPQGPMA